jgi:hypothetical protein
VIETLNERTALQKSVTRGDEMSGKLWTRTTAERIEDTLLFTLAATAVALLASLCIWFIVRIWKEILP